jgi:hypothetical protein
MLVMPTANLGTTKWQWRQVVCNHTIHSPPTSFSRDSRIKDLWQATFPKSHEIFLVIRYYNSSYLTIQQTVITAIRLNRVATTKTSPQCIQAPLLAWATISQIEYCTVKKTSHQWIINWWAMRNRTKETQPAMFIARSVVNSVTSTATTSSFEWTSILTRTNMKRHGMRLIT